MRFTNIELKQAEALLTADARPRSLDEPIENTRGELGTMGDLLHDPLSAAAYEDVVDAIAGEQLRALLSRLPGAACSADLSRSTLADFGANQ